MRPMKAWLIQWDWTGDHAKKLIDPDAKYILNSRMTQDAVVEFVEKLYAIELFNLTEQAEFAKRTRFYKEFRKHEYYPRTVSGIEFPGSFQFGHNPFLTARIVTNLRVIRNPDGTESLLFDENPGPSEAMQRFAERVRRENREANEGASRTE